MKYRLAVFDLAGTTIRDDHAVARCLQGALAEAGVHVSEAEVNAVMGIRKPVAIQRLLAHHGVAAAVDQIHDDFRFRMLMHYQQAEEIEGVTQLFEQLRSLGIRIAVDTGFDREITQAILERVGWGDLLDDSITSDEVAHGRPHPDMILALCRRAGVEPNETIKVGDTPADIQEGRAAGVGLNIAVSYGSHRAEQLAPHAPDAIIASPGELLPLLSERHEG